MSFGSRLASGRVGLTKNVVIRFMSEFIIPGKKTSVGNSASGRRVKLKLANSAGKLAAEHGLQAGAKNIVARALAINGIVSGAYCTLIYLTFALIYVAYFAIYLLVILGILFIGFLTGM